MELDQSSPQLRALAVGYEQNLKTLEILDADMQSVGKLPLRKFNFSKTFTCPIVERRLIFGIANGKDEAGKLKYKQVASIDWENNYERSCLLFIPKSIQGDTEQGGLEYTIQVMDMNADSFKPGVIKTINLTPWEMLVNVGEHEEILAPWNQTVFSKIEELDKMNMAQIEISYIKKGTSYNAFQSRMRYLPGTRYIILTYSDIDNDQVAVSVVKDSGSVFR